MIVNDPVACAEITEKFAAYEAALMADDVPALNALFWPSEYAIRFGVAESLYGHIEIANFRKARGGSPARVLRNTRITTFGADNAITTTEFLRDGEPRIGRQTQVWVKIPDLGWRITSAHVSLAGEKS
jgi:hypothetical protein